MTLTIVGSQLGDEGKGALVDRWGGDADVVVRYQGGDNAGHTVVEGGVEYKLSLVPSGAVRGTTGILATAASSTRRRCSPRSTTCANAGSTPTCGSPAGRTSSSRITACSTASKRRSRRTTTPATRSARRPRHRSDVRGQGRASGNPGRRPARSRRTSRQARVRGPAEARARRGRVRAQA